MTTPKKIIIQDLELADKEIARLRKENKNLKLIIEDSEKQMKLYMEDRDNLREEKKELKEKLDKLRTDNIYEEWLYS